MDILQYFVLPDEIQQYHIRVATLGPMERYIYSKDGGFLMPIQFPVSEVNTKEFEEYVKRYELDVLYEIDAPQGIAAAKLKEKVFLNQQVPKEYQWLMGFNATSFLQQKGFISIHKLFEIYAIIERNSNSVFFVAVSVFPERDAPLILNYINNLKSDFDKSGIPVRLQMPEMDTKELTISKVLHLFSFSANNIIEKVREGFKKHGWRVILKDEKYFSNKNKEKEKINEQIILCEGTDKNLFQLLNFPDILFSDEHNNMSIFQNVKTGVRRCVRDKDYLTSEEVQKLKKKFPKYHILDYYCLENYLYYPENIVFLLGSRFDKQAYMESIISEKKRTLAEKIVNISKARNTYLELKENHINPSHNGDSIIIEELSSDNFQVFYKHYDMKTHNKSFLNSFNLKREQLASTGWFKQQIIRVLEENKKST